METKKLNTTKLILELPIKAIKSYAEKTGWAEFIDAPKKQGKIKKVKNSLTIEKHVAKVLQDRLLSLYKKK